MDPKSRESRAERAVERALKWDAWRRFLRGAASYAKAENLEFVCVVRPSGVLSKKKY
jgi:hypothetical protein